MSVEVGRYLRKETRELALGLLSEPGYNDARCIKEAISVRNQFMHYNVMISVSFPSLYLISLTR